MPNEKNLQYFQKINLNKFYEKEKKHWRQREFQKRLILDELK